MYAAVTAGAGIVGDETAPSSGADESKKEAQAHSRVIYGGGTRARRRAYAAPAAAAAFT